MCSAVAFSRLFLLLLLGGSVLGSGIPMWEFLSREEKMHYLYNMFLHKVQGYCSRTTLRDCEKVLLLYGISNLEKMEEEKLDKMDPYQRGAMGIIWESMMKGMDMETASTDKNDWNGPKNNFFGVTPHRGNSIGSQEEASSEVHQYVPYDPKPLGPMMVRVLPDGNPVPGEEEIKMIKDEDAEEFKLMQVPPSIPFDEFGSGEITVHLPQNTSGGDDHHGTHKGQSGVAAT